MEDHAYSRGYAGVLTILIFIISIFRELFILNVPIHWVGIIGTFFADIIGAVINQTVIYQFTLALWSIGVLAALLPACSARYRTVFRRFPMPLSNPFTQYPPKSNDAPPSSVGVYELGWPCRTGYCIVYIGQGVIADRLRAHARSEKTWAVYRCQVVGSRRRSKQIERRELRSYRDRHGSLPGFNNQLGG